MKKPHKRKPQKPTTPKHQVKVWGIAATIPPELGPTVGIPQTVIQSITEGIMASQPSRQTSTPREITKDPQPDQDLLKTLAAVATNAWRAKRRLVDSETGEPKDGMKLLLRDVDGILGGLRNYGVEHEDPAGKPYDSGMALNVVTFEPTPGISSEEIKETVKPAVTWKGKLVQMAEVIVGTPIERTN